MSTTEPKCDLQRDAILAAGVPVGYLYEEMASGMQQARPGRAACLKALPPGHTLVVWRLDRLARSLLHWMELAAELQERQISVRVLEGPFAHLDTATSEGTLLLSLLGALAECERALIRERGVAGLVAARARGHKGGRRPKLSAAHHRQAHSLQRGGMSITEITPTLGGSRHTVYKALAQVQVGAQLSLPWCRVVTRPWGSMYTRKTEIAFGPSRHAVASLCPRQDALDTSQTLRGFLTRLVLEKQVLVYYVCTCYRATCAARDTPTSGRRLPHVGSCRAGGGVAPRQAQGGVSPGRAVVAHCREE